MADWLGYIGHMVESQYPDAEEYLIEPDGDGYRVSILLAPRLVGPITITVSKYGDPTTTVSLP